MPRTSLLLAGLVLAHAASAAYTEFFFATEQSDWKCPDLVFGCPPPGVCAHDSLVDKYYCCGPGGDSVCWTGSVNCNSNALECGDGENAFCCLDGREMCTQRTGQVNICWATADNPFLPFNVDFVNETFSSLSADNPAATTLPVELDDLAEATTTAVSSTAVSSTTASSSSPTDTDLDEDDEDKDSNSDSSTLSSGTIAGIVIGVVAGITLIALGAFFLWRRNRRPAYAPAPVAPPGPESGYAQGPAGVHEVFVPPAEMDGGGMKRVSEMDGMGVSEMDGKGVNEMEGSSPTGR